MSGKGSFDVTLLLGGNQGDRVKILSSAVNMICERVGTTVSISGLYESPAWGFESESDFVNQVLVIRTVLRPRAVLNKVLEIEKELGRSRQGMGYTDRLIDIDILCWEEKMFWTTFLQVPHVKMNERAFALVPLNEVQPDWRHPILEKTARELLNDLPDTHEVKPLVLALDD